MRLRPAALLSVAGLCLAGGACSTTPPDATPASVRAAASIESPKRRLEALAEIEAVGATARPNLHEAAAIIDPGLPQRLVPGSAEFRNRANSESDPRVVLEMLEDFYAPWLNKAAA